MLSFFRTNQLLASSLFLLYAAVLHLSAWYVPGNWEPGAYGLFSGYVYGWIGYETTAAHILVILLVILHGITVNVLDFSNKLSRDLTLFPGLFVILLSAFSPAFLQLAPQHLANTFLLFATGSLMQVYRTSKVAIPLFNAGLHLGIAFMFLPAYWVFVIYLFFGLNVLRSFQFRERLMVLSGFFVVVFLSGTVYFLLDRWPEFVDGQLRDLQVFADFGRLPPMGWIHLGILGIFLVIALFQHNQIMQKRIMQAQKKIDLMYWMLLFGGISCFFQAGLDEAHALVIVPALGMLTGMQFVNLENRTAELMHFLLFLLALFVQFRVFFF